jgi:hypothetical protein
VWTHPRFPRRCRTQAPGTARRRTTACWLTRRRSARAPGRLNALGTGIANVNDLSILRVNPGVTVTNFVQINNTGGLDNLGNIQVTQGEEGPSAAVSASGEAAITNESGATISGVGINAIQSLNGTLSISNSGMISGIQGVVLGGEGNITNNANGVITGSSGIAILASGGQTVK